MRLVLLKPQIKTHLKNASFNSLKRVKIKQFASSVHDQCIAHRNECIKVRLSQKHVTNKLIKHPVQTKGKLVKIKTLQSIAKTNFMRWVLWTIPAKKRTNQVMSGLKVCILYFCWFLMRSSIKLKPVELVDEV